MRSKFVLVFLLTLFIAGEAFAKSAARPANRAPQRRVTMAPDIDTAGLSDEDKRLVYEERNFPGCLEQTEGSQVAARARSLIQRLSPLSVRPKAPTALSGATK